MGGLTFWQGGKNYKKKYVTRKHSVDTSVNRFVVLAKRRYLHGINHNRNKFAAAYKEFGDFIPKE